MTNSLLTTIYYWIDLSGSIDTILPLFWGLYYVGCSRDRCWLEKLSSSTSWSPINKPSSINLYTTMKRDNEMVIYFSFDY